ncbi:Glucose-methanol-choline (GMC) oxidoreductase:NAD binding site [hydrothermal vent metagenome]|uniref:Glucose-methanol-choline (GMC) oxidoreductase:NAD binding site n=1 Tax=hydrothermal vent metagenome TaxID=652676 RepID=A0A3B0XLS4_9ZZZZ
MSKDYDVCVIGSGAGAGPVISELAKAGKSVIVLEKGPWLSEADFYKDEMACCRRSVYTPDLKDEQHVLEEEAMDGSWVSEATSESGWDFWNGNVVGGSSNFMSGYFYRLKPQDFKLLSEFGPIKGANIADWPISYADLEPYYTKTETEVGISGKIIPHKHQEPRSTPNFPYPPTSEHPIVKRIDKACNELKLTSLATPRAVLSRPANNRRSCEYSGYCGSYGCSSGAKGSSRAALLDGAVKTGNCEIRPHAKVYKLKSDSKGRVSEALYYDDENKKHSVSAKTFVVACHAIETSRLLLASTGQKHPNGLGNNYSQLGKNLLFSAGGSGTGEFHYSKMERLAATEMKTRGPFVNRGLQDWYFFEDKAFGGKAKGGVIDFLLRHPNPISKAMSVRWNDNDNLNWGHQLKRDLKTVFTQSQDLRFEVFNDWLPTDNCFVSLDPKVKDKWGSAVAKVRLGYHEHDLKVGEFLSAKAETVLQQMGATNIRSSVSGSPPANLVAGGCRFGNDIKTSVLNADCRVHDVENLYVTDGSFMPTGGSVPYTWTIYANAFRVADIIKRNI